MQSTGALKAPGTLKSTASLKSTTGAMDMQSTTKTKPFLQRKFQVGSAHSDKVNYTLAQKVFTHNKEDTADKKEAAATFQKAWNQSTIADPRVQKDSSTDLKRKLLQVRAGLMDERVVKPPKFHTDEKIEDQHKFIVALTGKGPIGKLTGKWFDATDMRGLPCHSTKEEWPDWNHSTCHATKEDQKAAQAVHQQKEERRKRMMAKDNKLNMSGYVPPTQAVGNVNQCLRERKVDFQDLKEQFKRELKVEFPAASEEKLQAMAQRLLNEKLLADEKVARFPVNHESFRPNLSLTTQDRRYKEHFHPGKFDFMEAEKRYGWSCCLNFNQDSRGCESKIINPDAWCLQGFERC